MDLYDHLEKAERMFEAARRNADAGDYMGALRAFGSAADAAGEASYMIVQKAYDGGASKAAIALAIGIKPSALRGLEKTRSSRGPKALENMLRLDQ